MEQNPFRDSDIHSGSQVILCLLWNPKVRYELHESATGTYPSDAQMQSTP
jgi:hypothetical protein